MFGFGKKDKSKEKPPQGQSPNLEVQDSPTEHALGPSPSHSDKSSAAKQGLLVRLTQGLRRTRSGITENLASLMLGKKSIDAEILEEIEMLLLSSDVGVEATQTIIDDLTQRSKRKQLVDTGALFTALREEMITILEPCAIPLNIDSKNETFVILMVGINGAGKTTTIGKLAKQFKNQGYSVMLAAGDTFRAAAVEQIQEWGKRNDIPVIAQQTGADSASVVYDAYAAAKARGINVLIADTAGRLHTQANLMDELKKVKRVLGKLDDNAPHEVMLVLDASIGQNAVVQASHFTEAVGVSGITITKLDGTAKGGVIFAVAKKLQLPIRYIGIGEKIDDLRPFESTEFVEALLSRE